MSIIRKRRLAIVTVCLSMILAASFVFSAWSLYTTHRQDCQTRDKTLDVVAGVIVIATKPAPGQKLTVRQKRTVQEFNARVSALINGSRC